MMQSVGVLLARNGMYHSPFLLCFLPRSTPLPFLCLTMHSSSLNSTVHPVVQSLVTEIKDLLSPGMMYPVVASLGSCGIGNVAVAKDIIDFPFGMVTWIGLCL